MRTIGKYRILGLLGRGGMGSVYKVMEPSLGKVMALKLLRPNELVLSLWGRERVIERFRAEARLLGGIRHRNVVEVFDYGEADGWPYFVMEYYCDNLGMVIGESYRVEEPSRRLPVSRAVGYALQVLSGLGRLHDGGIVHRDVKPYNLLLTDDEVVKLTDFGLSKVRGEVVGGPGNLKVGSPYYAAPEQEADPDGADGRADLHAVGVMLFRMLTGELPEPGVRGASGLAGDLDGEWDGFWAKAMAADRERRFGSAREMAEALAALHEGWLRRLDGVCAGADEGRIVSGADGVGRVRSVPVKVGERAARQAFGLDALWRPLEYWPGRFADRGDGTVADAASGLVWEKEAGPYAVTFAGAAERIARLNREGVAGRGDWRLPTMAELVTLLTPAPAGAGYCLAAPFSQPVRRVWSADRRTFVAAWAADVELGYVTYADFTCPLSVRAVCTA